MAVKDIALNLK